MLILVDLGVAVLSLSFSCAGRVGLFILTAARVRRQVKGFWFVWGLCAFPWAPGRGLIFFGVPAGDYYCAAGPGCVFRVFGGLGS